LPRLHSNTAGGGKSNHCTRPRAQAQPRRPRNRPPSSEPAAMSTRATSSPRRTGLLPGERSLTAQNVPGGGLGSMPAPTSRVSALRSTVSRRRAASWLPSMMKLSRCRASCRFPSS
jgi:hypothetical protein